MSHFNKIFIFQFQLHINQTYLPDNF